MVGDLRRQVRAVLVGDGDPAGAGAAGRGNQNTPRILRAPCSANVAAQFADVRAKWSAGTARVMHSKSLPGQLRSLTTVPTAASGAVARPWTTSVPHPAADITPSTSATAATARRPRREVTLRTPHPRAT